MKKGQVDVALIALYVFAIGIGLIIGLFPNQNQQSPPQPPQKLPPDAQNKPIPTGGNGLGSPPAEDIGVRRIIPPPATLSPNIIGEFDSDSDAVLDQYDNCPSVYNPDQADANGNSIGDACENSPILPIFSTPPEEDWTISENVVSETGSENYKLEAFQSTTNELAKKAVSAFYDYSSNGLSWVSIGAGIFAERSHLWQFIWNLKPVPIGKYFLRVTMKDEKGEQGSSVIMVNIDKKPEASFSVKRDGNSLIFDASLSIGKITKYSWEFSDGVIGMDKVFSRGYSGKNLGVQLTVSTASGLKSEAKFSIVDGAVAPK